MEKEKVEQIKKIMDEERVGYAYLYEKGGARKEYMISTTPENIANFIGSHMFDAGTMIITDMCDRLLLNTIGCFIDTCPDKNMLEEIKSFLVPIQMGMEDAGEVLEIERNIADAYFSEEDREITMAEYGMELS